MAFLKNLPLNKEVETKRKGSVTEVQRLILEMSVSVTTCTGMEEGTFGSISTFVGASVLRSFPYERKFMYLCLPLVDIFLNSTPGNVLHIKVMSHH